MVVTEGSFRLVNGVFCRSYIVWCKSEGYDKATLQQMRHELLSSFVAWRVSVIKCKHREVRSVRPHRRHQEVRGGEKRMFYRVVVFMGW